MMTIKELLDKEEKEKKGYMYDSLVFRYKMAREAEMRANIENKTKLARIQGKDLYDIEIMERSRCTRDFMRFLEILNEAIGEHN